MSGLHMRVGSGAALAVAALLGGCTAIGGLTGGVAAIASGTATGNPAVGVAVGIGVKASVDASLKAFSRRLSEDEQSRIAQTIGAMQVGETRPWRVQHTIVPFSDSSGDVTVLRAFETPLANCREALFRVGSGPDVPPAGQAFFVSACAAADGWRWAVAEPAVGRWGALQ